MNFHVSFSRPKRRALLFLLAFIAAWLIFTAVRSRRLLANGRQIERHAAHFPRDYLVGRRDSPLLTYLVLGDSTAAGWGAENLNGTYPHRVAKAIAARGFRVRVVNRALGGARLRDVVRHQLSFQNLRPDFITLSFGANDATHFTSKADYARQLQTLIAALKASGAKQILMANVPDMYRAPALPLPLSMATNFRALSLNRTLDEALRGSTIGRVDLYGRGKLDYGRDKNLYAADLFHPSSAGYEVWTRLFIEAFTGS